MRKTRYNAYAAACPTRKVLDRIADKWTVLIIGLLEQRPHRFGELLRGIDGISQKMLTQTLRSLEYDGLVDRRAKPTVPVTVEYSLTNAGRTLTEINVVRSIQKIGTSRNSTHEWKLALGRLPKDADRIAILIQSSSSGAIIGARLAP